jgi:hypothetical protein
MLSNTKLQVINSYNCCVWLVNLFELNKLLVSKDQDFPKFPPFDLRQNHQCSSRLVTPRDTECPFYGVPAYCGCRGIFRPIRVSYAIQLSCAQGHSVLPSSYLRVLHAPPKTCNLRTLTWFPWPPSCSSC